MLLHGGLHLPAAPALKIFVISCPVSALVKTSTSSRQPLKKPNDGTGPTEAAPTSKGDPLPRSAGDDDDRNVRGGVLQARQKIESDLAVLQEVVEEDQVGGLLFQTFPLAKGIPRWGHLFSTA